MMIEIPEPMAHTGRDQTITLADSPHWIDGL